MAFLCKRLVADYAFVEHSHKCIRPALQVERVLLLQLAVCLLDNLHELFVAIFLKNKFLRIVPQDTDLSLTIFIYAFFCFLGNAHQGKEMFGRRGIVHLTLVPPLLHALIRIVISARIYDETAVFYPICQMRMCFRREGFHVAIRHEEHLHVLPSFRITHVLDVRDTDGHASLEQRKRLAIEVGELRVVVTFDWSRRALEHQGIRHQDRDAL